MAGSQAIFQLRYPGDYVDGSTERGDVGATTSMPEISPCSVLETRAWDTEGIGQSGLGQPSRSAHLR